MICGDARINNMLVVIRVLFLQLGDVWRHEIGLKKP
jgi:hypothetical protein